ncbi:MAG: hypothetical protein NZ959_09490 [Armatimonadetes bacterium]|nr:hypothetical protein [Armatimonadota bacterium]MDW8122180.1 hypothetical protein [Armatimonadota bacterium]
MKKMLKILVFVTHLLWCTPLLAQRDVLRDLMRALREPRLLADVLIRTDLLVVAPDEMIFNHFRSALPSGARTQFFPLSDVEFRFSELNQFAGSIVVLVDRSRGQFPIEQRQLIPYDLTLIRRQDLIIAGDVDRIDRQVRYRLFVSAPSFPGLKKGIADLLNRRIKEVEDIRFSIAQPVRLSVVVSNGGKEAFEAFAQSSTGDFIWTTPEDLSRVEDLLVTETEIYLMLPPVPDRLKHRWAFDPAKLAPNQSVVARQSKGGDFYQVLLYSPFKQALIGLMENYADPASVPEEPLIITHPVLGPVGRMLVVPFGDIPRYRDRVGDLATQVFRVLQASGLVSEVVMADKPPAYLQDFTSFQQGTVETDLVVTLGRDAGADLLISGRLVGFEPLTIYRHTLSSSPSPAADRRIWTVTRFRDEEVRATLEARLYDGQTGRVLWTKTTEGIARSSFPMGSFRSEAVDPPPLQPERSVPTVRDQRLYATAVTDALMKLSKAMQWEILWTKDAVPYAVVSPAPVPQVEGIVGKVDGPFLYLDIGAQQGLKEGDVLLLYRIVVIKTERKVVRLEEEVGRAVVVDLFPEACRILLEATPKIPPEVGMRARLLPRTVKVNLKEQPKDGAAGKEAKKEEKDPSKAK